jgi:hypothetical protein
MARYSVYPGEFACHVCKKSVKTLRLYAKEMYLTWMCEDKHVSEVSLTKKKKKVNDERTV